MSKIVTNIAELVGNTPLMELVGYEKKHDLKAKVLGKLEYFNPSGSIKDRAALNMILAAEEKGLLKPGDTIVENTSGNTGIGLAAFSASRGYKLEVFMEPGQSIERQQILKAYGATVHIMTDLPEVAKALADGTFTVQFYQDALQRYCDAQPTHYYFINQLANEANPGAHYDHTGPEIWEATGGKVDYVVALAGTAGTITGLGRYFREKNPDVKIIAAQPSISSRPSPENPHPATIDGVNPFNDPGFPDAAKAPFIVDFKYDECFDINGEDAYATNLKDGFLIRRFAVEAGIPIYTSLDTAKALIDSLEKRKQGVPSLIDITKLR